MWTEAEQLPRVGKRPAVSSSQNYCSPKCAPPVHKSPINVDLSMAQILSWDVKAVYTWFYLFKKPVKTGFLSANDIACVNWCAQKLHSMRMKGTPLANKG